MGVKIADHMSPREWVLLERAEVRKKILNPSTLISGGGFEGDWAFLSHMTALGVHSPDLTDISPQSTAATQNGARTPPKPIQAGQTGTYVHRDLTKADRRDPKWTIFQEFRTSLVQEIA